MTQQIIASKDHTAKAYNLNYVFTTAANKYQK